MVPCRSSGPVIEIGLQLRRNVLIEVSSGSDREHLNAATDTENWEPALERPRCHRYFELVSHFIDRAEPWMRLPPIALGRHIVSPRQEDSIENLEQSSQRIPRQGHEDSNRSASRGRDSIDVKLNNAGPGKRLPDSVRRDTDDRH